MPYLGGKSQAGTYQRIINLIPPHDVYVEPFFGSGAIARLKRPARLSFGADLAAPKMALPEGLTFVHGCGIDFLEHFDWRGGGIRLLRSALSPQHAREPAHLRARIE